MRCVIVVLLVTLLAKPANSKARDGDFVLLIRGQSKPAEQLQCNKDWYEKIVPPQLFWKNEPAKTQSFALTVYDADAPAARGKNHWTVFNVSANTHSLPRFAGNQTKTLVPAGTLQSRNDFGIRSYSVICQPTDGHEHHYVFTLWALDTKVLILDQNVSPAISRLFIRQHQIGRARFIVTGKN